jgi:hypothetical protein
VFDIGQFGFALEIEGGGLQFLPAEEQQEVQISDPAYILIDQVSVNHSYALYSQTSADPGDDTRVTFLVTGQTYEGSDSTVPEPPHSKPVNVTVSPGEYLLFRLDVESIGSDPFETFTVSLLRDVDDLDQDGDFDEPDPFRNYLWHLQSNITHSHVLVSPDDDPDDFHGNQRGPDGEYLDSYDFAPLDIAFAAGTEGAVALGPPTQAVPEPGSMLLWGLGALVCGAHRVLRRKTAA